MARFEKTIDSNPPVGIQNGTEVSANNCFLISIVQTIFTTPQLRQTFILSESPYKQALINLATQYEQKLNDKKVTLNVNELRAQFLDEGLDMSSQYDATEVLQLMLTKVNTDHLSTSWTDTKKVDIKNATSGNSSAPTPVNLNGEFTQSQEFVIHPLEIPKNEKLFEVNNKTYKFNDLFSNFKSNQGQTLEPVVVKQNNKVIKAPIIKQTLTIQKEFNKFLSFQIKRSEKHGKNNAPIIVNENLYTGHTLQNFFVHSGPTTRAGHYISYIRKPDGKWYECNDSVVKEISREKALQMAQQAYLLNYTKA